MSTGRSLDEDGNEAHAFAPPPKPFTAQLLTAAIQDAVAHAGAPLPTPSSVGITAGPKEPREPQPGRLPRLRLHLRPQLAFARWGRQLHITPIAPGHQAREVSGLERGQVAGYLGKYATKHTEALGGLDRRVDLEDVPMLVVNPHIRRLVAVTLLLAHHYRAPEPGQGRDLKLDRWAHQLGYGGHWLTKSRSWSTTFTALRAARRDWQQHQNPDPTTPNEDQVQVAVWQLADIGSAPLATPGWPNLPATETPPHAKPNASNVPNENKRRCPLREWARGPMSDSHD